MNTKNTIFLLVVALVVMGAIFYTKQKEEETFTSAAIPEQTLPSVTSGTIERIVIDAPDQKEVTLTKADGQWYTDVEKKYEAEINAVNAALNALSKPVNATVVSSNPDSFPEYHVSDTSGTKVQIFEQGKSEPEVAMIVGKDGPSAFSTYVRLDGEDEVLNAKASLSMAYKRPDGWRDKQIFDFSGPSATRIEQSGTSATFTVQRTSDEKWNFDGEHSGEADAARINSLANMMASLRANEFVETGETQSLADLGLDPARQTITLTYEDKTTSPSKSTTVTLLIGNEAKTAGDWYAKRASKNDIFTIGSNVSESLSPDPETIKVNQPEPEPAPADAADETTATPGLVEPDTAATTATLEAPGETAETTTPLTVSAEPGDTTATQNAVAEPVPSAETTATLPVDQLTTATP